MLSFKAETYIPVWWCKCLVSMPSGGMQWGGDSEAILGYLGQFRNIRKAKGTALKRSVPKPLFAKCKHTVIFFQQLRSPKGILKKSDKNNLNYSPVNTL